MSKELKCCSPNVWGTADPPFVPSVGIVKKKTSAGVLVDGASQGHCANGLTTHSISC